MVWRPIRDKVIVKVKKLDEKSEGGIYLPKDHRDKQDQAKEEGEVVAFGPEVFFDSPSDGTKILKIGDVITYPRYAGKTIDESDSGFEYRVILDKDVLAIKEV